MERNVARIFESLLIVAVLISVGFGVTWETRQQPSPRGPLPAAGTMPFQVGAVEQVTPRPGDEFLSVPTPQPRPLDSAATAVMQAAPPEVTSTPGDVGGAAVATPIPVNLAVD